MIFQRELWVRRALEGCIFSALRRTRLLVAFLFVWIFYQFRHRRTLLTFTNAAWRARRSGRRVAGAMRWGPRYGGGAVDAAPRARCGGRCGRGGGARCVHAVDPRATHVHACWLIKRCWPVGKGSGSGEVFYAFTRSWLGHRLARTFLFLTNRWLAARYLVIRGECLVSVFPRYRRWQWRSYASAVIRNGLGAVGLWVAPGGFLCRVGGVGGQRILLP